MKDTILSYIRSNRRAILYIIAAIIGIYALGRFMSPKDTRPDISGETYSVSFPATEYSKGYSYSYKFIDGSKFSIIENGKSQGEGLYVYDYPNITIYWDDRSVRSDNRMSKSSDTFTITSDGKYIIHSGTKLTRQ